MRVFGIAWTIGIALLAAAAAGCAGLEQRKSELKAKGIEVEGGKVVKVYRF